ncbi:MAG: hypothetical protein D6690_04980 [Nitrospirae bacterium]|nr:MAG: hypothetical protein D6690_04980 [Nitrospirota bacterium]
MKQRGTLLEQTSGSFVLGDQISLLRLHLGIDSNGSWFYTTQEVLTLNGLQSLYSFTRDKASALIVILMLPRRGSLCSEKPLRHL